MTSPLALSTMYFQRWEDTSDLRPFFELGKSLGFEAFELSHILAPETVAGVVPGRQRVAAVHHPCPRPTSWGDDAAFTSVDTQTRRRASAALVASVRTASRLSASTVVLHLGHVEDTPDRAIHRLRFELESRYRAGQAGSERFRQAAAEIRDRVAAAEAEHLERAMDSLTPAVKAAAGQGIQLAVETGYHPHELPTPTGLQEFLAAFPATLVGAWLDTGHVAARARLSATDWLAWFAAVDERCWLGAHLHDIAGLRDHLVPGVGDLDFQLVLGRLPATAILTLEVDWYHTPAEVAAGARYVSALLQGLQG